MFRVILFYGVQLFGSLIFVLPTVLAAQEGAEITMPAFAVTVGEKEQLLEKTEEMLKWFRTLNTDNRQHLSAKDFRVKISPLELMQAAALLKQKEQPDIARMVREILPFLQPTPLECFEIQERLGNETLDSFQQERELLAGDTPDSTTRIKDGATLFLKDFLNPAEKMALYREPQNPSEIMKAVDVLVIAGRPVVIRYYLRKFLAANTEPKEYAQIAEALGARKLLQIANNKDFAPQGAEAVAKIYAEAKKFWQDENVVAESIEQWQHLEPNTQNTKPLHALWNGNNVSLTQLIEELGKTNDEKEVHGIIAVILSFATEGRECLAVSLNSGNQTLAANAANGLAGSIRPDETFLLYPALFAESPLADEQRNQITETLRKRNLKLPESETHILESETAAAELLNRANDYFERNRSLKPDFDGYVRFWNWDEKEKKPKYIRMILPAAYRLFAYRYAEQAYRIKPEIQEVQRLYLLTLFERTAYLNGLDNPLDPDATGLTERIAEIDGNPKQQQVLLEEVLQSAIRKEYYAAAQVAAQLLGHSGNRELLQAARNGKPSPLIQAVVAKNRRVRFAALEAVMKIQPETPYSGSSFVAETLVWFARADGQHRLVAAHPKLTNAAKTAGYFIACGYQGELAQTCREAMQLAADTPDVELVVVDSRTPEPSVSDFVQEMHNDARTADIPIAVLSDTATVPDSVPDFQNRFEMQKTDRLQPNAPFAFALSRTYPPIVNDDGAKWLNDDLFGKTAVEPVPSAIRVTQAHKALGWIKTIVESAQNGQKIYHFEDLEGVMFRALGNDVSIEKGLELAAVLKSGTAQAALHETAANSLHPIELRRNAANAFTKSIESFGILLRGQQIQHLYDRYNASEFEPKETQELLGNLIDFIEKKTDNKGNNP